MTGLPFSPAEGPQAWLVNDGARLHLHYGPIDLLIAAEGSAPQVRAAYRQATRIFQSILPSLVAELPELRTTISCSGTSGNGLKGIIAQHMFSAALPFAASIVTPMIAVAGAVADHVLGAMLENRQLQRVCVNNGGDIALYLAPGNSYRVGICARSDSESHDDIVTLTSTDRVGGIATSGWRGRSHSLGVADAVTVLANTAAKADAAATVIANAIDVPHSPRIRRQPACALNPDSDLGHRPVTVDVDCLSPIECTDALASGRLIAEQMCRENQIISAYLKLQDRSDVITRTSLFGKSLKSGDAQEQASVLQNDAAQAWQQCSANSGECPHAVPSSPTVSH